MEIKKIQEPIYQLTLSAEEMSRLWNLVHDADYKLIKHAGYFYRKLEEIRPAGGFKEGEQ